MEFKPSNNHIYRIVSSMNSKMVLDMSQNLKDLNRAIVYQWNNGSNQKFAFREVQNGKFAIFCAKGNMVVVPEQGGHHNGARLVLQMPKKVNYQLYTIQPIKNQKLGNRVGWMIKTFYGKALDICQQKCVNNQQVIQWDVHGGLNQIWFIEQVN